MKKILSMTLFMLIIPGISMLLAGCRKNNDNNTPTGQPPTVTTGVINVAKPTSATCVGEVTNDGTADVTSRGICWSTSPQPTIADNKTLDGAGGGSFTSSLTGLTHSATYYARAYATNSFGTGYGTAVLFIVLLPGELYKGGLLVYLLRSGDPGYEASAVHGLICSPSDFVSGTQWYNTGYSITGATGTALGTGMANTNTIVSTQGPGAYSAKYCADLELGGYKDWFLPSKDELYKLYLNRDAFKGISPSYYWSSTEGGFTTAWIQSFITGVQSSYDKKGGDFQLRPFRSF